MWCQSLVKTDVLRSASLQYSNQLRQFFVVLPCCRIEKVRIPKCAYQTKRMQPFHATVAMFKNERRSNLVKIKTENWLDYEIRFVEIEGEWWGLLKILQMPLVT